MTRRFWNRPFFIRLFNWEYWSFLAVYAWIYPIWIYYCLKARSLFFFSASNPTMENGGFINESKKDIHPLIPSEFSPATFFVDLPVDPGALPGIAFREGLRFPMIGKPNKGGRGRGVKILQNDADLVDYAQHTTIDFHIQEFVAYKEEVGIFYYRIPGDARGQISGIVKKEFLSVTGDGVHSIRSILAGDSRARLQEKALESMYGDNLDEILPAGEKRVLVPYGNHARGALFLDDSHLADEELTATIDRICQQIDGFYYGRLDIRYDNWTDLKQGRKLAIIEVNGAGSEPTHIYDPRHSLFFGWKEIIRHWKLLYRISILNHRRGFRYLSFREGITMFREDKQVSKKLALMPA